MTGLAKTTNNFHSMRKILGFSRLLFNARKSKKAWLTSQWPGKPIVFFLAKAAGKVWPWN